MNKHVFFFFIGLVITKPIPSDPLSCLYTSISQTDFNYGYKFCITDNDVSSIQG